MLVQSIIDGAGRNNQVLVVRWDTAQCDPSQLRQYGAEKDGAWRMWLYAGDGKAQNYAQGAAWQSRLTVGWWKIKENWGEYVGHCRKNDLPANSTQPALSYDASEYDVAKAAYDKCLVAGWQPDTVVVESTRMRGATFVVSLVEAGLEPGEPTQDWPNPLLIDQPTS